MLQRPLNEISMNEILIDAVHQNASDIHLSVGRPPVFRIDGALIDQSQEALTNKHIIRLSEETMTEKIKNKFSDDLEVDYAYSVEHGEEIYRFRVNTFTQKGFVGMVMRNIPNKIKTIQQLGLPETLFSFTKVPRGLVLVTGPTGSGKSTTLAAMIDEINRERNVHIVTIEDPIEYLHTHKRSVVNQREIGQDSQSFTRALKSVLREDPDVILLGEMRDLETIHTAITLAETGHLVFATLHTTSASQTIDRIVDVFPPEQQEQIKVQLAQVLEAVISQTLVPSQKGGRICLTEILISNPAVKANIRNSKTSQLNDVMQMQGKIGMHTLEQSLVNAVKNGNLTADQAKELSSKPDVIQQLLSKYI